MSSSVRPVPRSRAKRRQLDEEREKAPIRSGMSRREPAPRAMMRNALAGKWATQSQLGRSNF